MHPEEKERRVKSLKSRGFDTSHINEEHGFITIGCSQCVAAFIMTVACHETGCPNKVIEA